jgi:hypothetical protein
MGREEGSNRYTANLVPNPHGEEDWRTTASQVINAGINGYTPQNENPVQNIANRTSPKRK